MALNFAMKPFSSSGSGAGGSGRGPGTGPGSGWGSGSGSGVGSSGMGGGGGGGGGGGVLPPYAVPSPGGAPPSPAGGCDGCVGGVGGPGGWNGSPPPPLASKPPPCLSAKAGMGPSVIPPDGAVLDVVPGGGDGGGIPVPGPCCIICPSAPFCRSMALSRSSLRPLRSSSSPNRCSIFITFPVPAGR